MASFAWGLVDGAVLRGNPLPPGGSALAALSCSGWCPLAASAHGSNDDDEAPAAAAGGVNSKRPGGPGRPTADARAPLAQRATGYDHEVAVDARGGVLARGWNVHGEADPDKQAPRLDCWTAVAALSRIVVSQVAAGERHSLALAANGRVFVWGQQCGRGDGASSFGGSDAGSDSDEGEAPASNSGSGGHSSGSGGGGRRPGARHRRHHHRLAHSPVTCVAGPGTLEPEPVAQIAAGGRHSLALTRTSGAVLAWGSNLQGQCGVDRREAPVEVPTPRRVAPLGGVPIASIAAGANHSAAVSRDGAAYAWGCGLDGALGAGLAARNDPVLSRRSSRRRRAGSASPSPSPSPGPSPLRQGGSVLCGEAGRGASSSVPLLMEGPGLDDEEVVQVACGSRHTLLRCASGAVYACGWNRYGSCCCCSDAGGAGARGGSGTGSGSGVGGSGGSSGSGSSSSGGCGRHGGEGLAPGWACPHGDAIYGLLRVRLPRPEGGGRSGEPKAMQVYAGGWFSVVVVAAP